MTTKDGTARPLTVPPVAGPTAIHPIRPVVPPLRDLGADGGIGLDTLAEGILNSLLD